MVRTRSHRGVSWRILVATVLVVVACDGGDNDDDSAVTDATRVVSPAELEAALLTAEEVGSGWHTEGAEVWEVGEGDDIGGRCPAGSSFTVPTAAMLVRFEPPDDLPGDNTIDEALLTFENRADLDAWSAALESCVGERWEESDDPVEHVSLERIEVAEQGDDASGFLLQFAHSADDDVAHTSRWFFVRLGDALVLVSGEDYDLDSSDDEELLVGVVERAVSKAEATLQS